MRKIDTNAKRILKRLDEIRFNKQVSKYKNSDRAWPGQTTSAFQEHNDSRARIDSRAQNGGGPSNADTPVIPLCDVVHHLILRMFTKMFSVLVDAQEEELEDLKENEDVIEVGLLMFDQSLQLLTALPLETI